MALYCMGLTDIQTETTLQYLAGRLVGNLADDDCWIGVGGPPVGELRPAAALQG